MPPAISVVIPTYNRAGLLPQAIESVLAQTFADFELIVVDDASTDDTAAVVARFADPRVRSIRLDTNGGVSRARNEGFGRALGEFVALLDDDDYWFPTFLERLTDRLRDADDPRIGIIYPYFYSYNERTGECKVPPYLVSMEGDILDRLLAGCWIQTAMMIRRSAMLAIGGYDESMGRCQDYDLILQLAAASHRAAVVAEPLMVYRDHDGVRNTRDPSAMLAGFFTLRDRWGPVIRARLGRAAYRRWVVIHSIGWRFGATGRAVDVGDRLAAWRHCLAIAAGLPERGVMRILVSALTLTLLGRRAYETARRLKHRGRGAPAESDPQDGPADDFPSLPEGFGGHPKS